MKPTYEELLEALKTAVYICREMTFNEDDKDQIDELEELITRAELP